MTETRFIYYHVNKRNVKCVKTEKLTLEEQVKRPEWELTLQETFRRKIEKATEKVSNVTGYIGVLASVIWSKNKWKFLICMMKIE